MSETLAESNGQAVARPLKVLVPLIKEDLENGRTAAERAGLPYYRAAGEKMLEAKGQLKHGEFMGWIKRTFSISPKQASLYMRLAEAMGAENLPAGKFSSFSEAYRATVNPNYNKPHTVRPPGWHEPVKKVLDRVDTETLNAKKEELKRAEERDAQRELAIQLIDIGYKVLARELHPDKGGSREAMARLNAVRDRLKQHV